jgi:transcriptional regulator with XRE-family HTH domain
MTAHPVRRTPIRQDPEAVARLRTKRNLSQRALAARLDVHHSLLSRIEAGTRTASDALLAAMARVLGCPMTALRRKPGRKP